MHDHATMDANDAVYGSLASCYVTINGRRLNFMSMIKFESKWDTKIVEVPILGKVGLGHKVAGANGKWSGTAHYNQSYLRAVADTYQKTGVMPYFEIQVVNEDPTSVVGRQTVILHGCLCESFVLAKFEAGEDILDEELAGTYESWSMPEKFNELPGVEAGAAG